MADCKTCKEMREIMLREVQRMRSIAQQIKADLQKNKNKTSSDQQPKA
jgi:hypothetical protein